MFTWKISHIQTVGKKSPINQQNACANSFLLLIYFKIYFRSNFAVKQAECEVNGQVAKVINDFHDAKKPIGYVIVEGQT